MEGVSVTVDIYCDGRRAGSDHKPHDQYLVARWIRIDGEWARTSRVVDPGAEPRFLKGQLSQLIYDDDPLKSPADWRSDARAVYPLKCPRCGFDEWVRKSAKLIEFLDAHEPDDVSSPFLSELVAKIA